MILKRKTFSKGKSVKKVISKSSDFYKKLVSKPDVMMKEIMDPSEVINKVPKVVDTAKVSVAPLGRGQDARWRLVNGKLGSL